MPPRKAVAAPLDALLPDPLLGAVLGFAGVTAGPAVTLVCKRWRRLFYAEASLWRRFVVRPGPAAAAAAWLPAKHALLARVAPWVKELQVFDRCAGEAGAATAPRWDLAAQPLGLEAFLGLLPRDSLTSLRLAAHTQHIGAQLAAAALGFPQLQQLDLVLPGTPPNLPALLRHLRLSSFTCACGTHFPAALFDSLVDQPSLQALSLTTSELLPAAQLAALTALTGLRSLTLTEGGERGDGSALQPPSLAAFPRLHKCVLQASSPTSLQVEGACMESFSVEGRLLMLVCLSSLPSLQRLLAGVPLLAGPISCLTLDGACVLAAGAAALQAGPHVSALKVLQLRGCTTECTAAFLPPLLQQAPILEALTLDGCELAGLPPDVTLPGLHLLRLDQPALPPQLAGATNLIVLELRQALDLEAVELLARLPKLKCLFLKGPGSPPPARVLRALRRRLPQLRVVLK